MTDQPTTKRDDPLCPDCNQPFNVVKDFKTRVTTMGMRLNVYQCPHCKHRIYKAVDGTTQPPPPEETNETQ